MLKTYQFQTHCKGDSHSSKTANSIFPGLMIKQRWTPLGVASETVLKFNCIMLVETRIWILYFAWRRLFYRSCCRVQLQLFHVAIMMCTLRQADAVFIDFKTRRHAVLLHPQPTLSTACGPIVSVILAELVCVLFFYNYTKQKLDKIK